MTELCLNAQNTKHLDFLLNKLHDKGKSDYVMIFAHRGDWRNAPENSLRAFKNCIDAGIDGIEIDVHLTKDGELVLMHDNTLDRTTNGTGKVSDKTLMEIKKLYLKSPLGVVTHQRVPTFRELLQLAKGKILIHVDKWPPVVRQVFEIAQQEGCLNQLILRSSWSSEKVKRILGNFYCKINYIPVLVCNGATDDERLDDFLQNIKTSVISLSFNNDEYKILNRVSEIKQKGYRIWVNSMWSKFNGGHDDEMAINDLNNSYGWLVKHGANIIMSDRPFLLKTYLTKIGKRKI